MKKVKIQIIAVLLSISAFAYLVTPISEIRANEFGEKTVIISENDIEVTPSQDIKNLADEMNMDVRTFRTELATPYNRTANNENEKSVTLNNYFMKKQYISARGSGSKDYNEDVLNYAFNVYSTIYYSTTKISNINMVKLTKASGGVRNFDSGFQVTNQNVIMSTFGSYDGHPYQQQRVEHNTSNTTWSYNAPSWNYVSSQASHIVGISINVTVRRGTASYKTNVQNLY